MMTTKWKIRWAGVVVAAAGAAGPAGGASAAPAEDIAVSGFNADVVTDADPVDRRVTQPFDVERAAWFESGLMDGAGARPGGLPCGKSFSTQTGSGAKFTLRPASEPNVLRLSRPAGASADSAEGLSGTLQVKPGQYSSIAVLAASANSTASASATGTIHYSAGDPTPFTYLAPDWDYATSNSTEPPALSDLRRNNDCGANGKNFVFEANKRFGLWETVITPAQGLDPTRTVTSITFNRTNDGSGSGQPSTSIFAVSGEPIPEAASMAALFGAASGLVLLTRYRR